MWSQFMSNIIVKKFIAGIETYLLGLWFTISPVALNYALGFDYSKLWLDPRAVTVIGLVITIVRMKDSIGEAPAVTKAKNEGLTGSEVAGNNAANRD